MVIAPRSSRAGYTGSEVLPTFLVRRVTYGAVARNVTRSATLQASSAAANVIRAMRIGPVPLYPAEPSGIPTA